MDSLEFEKLYRDVLNSSKHKLYMQLQARIRDINRNLSNKGPGIMTVPDVVEELGNFIVSSCEATLSESIRAAYMLIDGSQKDTHENLPILHK